MVGQGGAWHGMAGRGEARLGKARQGKVFLKQTMTKPNKRSGTWEKGIWIPNEKEKKTYSYAELKRYMAETENYNKAKEKAKIRKEKSVERSRLIDKSNELYTEVRNLEKEIWKLLEQ